MKHTLLQIVEPMARTKASGLRFWRPGAKLTHRFSYPFEVPVRKAQDDAARVLGWLLCRVEVGVVAMRKKLQGSGFAYRVRILLLDRGSLTPTHVVYQIESKEKWRHSREAAIAGSMAGTTAFNQFSRTGMSLSMAKGYMRKVFLAEGFYEEGAKREEDPDYEVEGGEEDGFDDLREAPGTSDVPADDRRG